MQGAKLVDSADLKTWPAQEWYERSKPKMSLWLSQDIDAVGKQRLMAIGNIVQPKVAHMAMHILGAAESS